MESLSFDSVSFSIFRKKSDATKIPSLKPGAKKPVSKSPSLPKRQLSPDPGLSKPRTGSTGHLALLEDTQQPLSRSIEDIEKDVSIYYFKVNGYTIKGSNSAISIFAVLPNEGQLLQERICSQRSKFFPV